MTDLQHSSIKSVAIIGSGPAGYTAAIYAARAGLDVILYEGIQPGGQLTTTTSVENYPGYPNGVLGPQMMEDFRNQAKNVGADIQSATITAVNFSTSPFQLTVNNTAQVTAQTVIIATGASAKWLGLPAEQRLQGKGVSACATCDGFFFRDQEVVVVGGGDTAAEEACYLANLCSKIHLLVRSGKMRASHTMQQRVLQHPKISIHFYTEIEDILGDTAVTGVKVFNKQTQVAHTLPVEGVFIAIGHQPNTSLFTSYLNINEQGYIQTVPGSTRTNIPGIFAAGDVQDSVYRQAVTAAGTGCMAALEAERFLSASVR
jgi:thioredoxin reductase (NADPH)